MEVSKTSYQSGLEDATELCLSEIVEASTKDEAVCKVKTLLGYMKTEKFERIKNLIGAP
jgi:hypothetical protein